MDLDQRTLLPYPRHTVTGDHRPHAKLGKLVLNRTRITNDAKPRDVFSAI